MVNRPKKLMQLSWKELQSLTLRERAELYNVNGHAYHCLLAQQFDREMLDDLGQLATCIRRIAKSKAGMQFLEGLLDHKRAMLYFSQPSSRTFLSFYAACQILGMRPAEVRDTRTSSEMKGESLEDTVRTFSSYFDIIIMRTPEQGFAEKMAWVLSNTERPIPIINAGSGKDQHPTQALLDIYTLQRSFERIGGIDGKTIVFVGDLARGRTVRSLASLLTNYRDVRLVFVAPEMLQIGSDILEQLQEARTPYQLSDDFDAAIREADAIYMTRIQDEWDTEAEKSSAIDIRNFAFGKHHLRSIKPHTVIIHPLPRRQ